MLTRSVRLYELGDVEAAEVPRRFGPVDLDGAHASLAGALARGMFELFQGWASSLGDELDDAVVPVGHPPGQAERLGAPDQKKAEADPLDVSLDDAMKAL
jgi:hypothetical protein